LSLPKTVENEVTYNTQLVEKRYDIKM